MFFLLARILHYISLQYCITCQFCQFDHFFMKHYCTFKYFSFNFGNYFSPAVGQLPKLKSKMFERFLWVTSLEKSYLSKSSFNFCNALVVWSTLRSFKLPISPVFRRSLPTAPFLHLSHFLADQHDPQYISLRKKKKKTFLLNLQNHK